MEEKRDSSKKRSVTRRRFVYTMGAAAAAAALRGDSQGSSASQAYYYQDSFGNVAPADPALTGLGIYPPPVPATSSLPAGAANPGAVPEAGATTPASGYPKYNILLIVVDQMRNPAFWLPSGNNWLSTYGDSLHNIAQLARSWSFLFPNYFVAATVCTPSRASLLTGLYSQQTSVFQTSLSMSDNSTAAPPLLPYNSSWSPGGAAGFPTIGNVLSQSFGGANGYDCAWIGKWHLSCDAGAQDSSPGQNGPSDYGFGSIYNLPTANTSNPYPAHTAGLGYPSPNGVVNEGAGGDFLDSFTQTSPAHDDPAFGYTTPPLQYNGNPVAPIPNFSQLSDAAIAYAFTNYWLPYANTNLNGGSGANGQLLTPWFCAVSFVNPHDISDFPYSFGLITPGNTQFTPPGNNLLPSTGYQPAPIVTSNNGNLYPGSSCLGGSGMCATDGDEVFIRNFPSLYGNLPPGEGNTGPWNYETQTINSAVKPGLQYYYQQYVNDVAGQIQSPGSYNSSNNNWATPQAWTAFLNYYAWLESCVDYQVGQVLGGLSASAFNNNTVVIFTSDHGEYAGSHGLHGKGGALYEESLNVPLIISYPSARNANNSAGNGSVIALPYACSSVDLLPFLYTLSLGNESWRNNSSDMIYHLGGRESLADAIYYYNNPLGAYPYPGIQHRRISGISLNNSNPAGANWQQYQPFVLHTTDEIPVAISGSNAVPSHAIAFRTVDQTEINLQSAPFAGRYSYGGGKLGAYSFWDTVHATNAPIVGIFNNSSVPAQYEFYNFSPSKNNGSANPQEVGNEFLDGGGNVSALALPYETDFFNTGNNNGVNILNELYALYTNGSNSNNIQQVQAAIQTAFNNYIEYLKCKNEMTGSDGKDPGGYGSGFCGNYTP